MGVCVCVRMYVTLYIYIYICTTYRHVRRHPHAPTLTTQCYKHANNARMMCVCAPLVSCHLPKCSVRFGYMNEQFLWHGVDADGNCVAAVWIAGTLAGKRLPRKTSAARRRIPASDIFTHDVRVALTTVAEDGKWGGSCWERVLRDGVDNPQVWYQHCRTQSNNVLGLAALRLRGWFDPVSSRYGPAHRSHLAFWHRAVAASVCDMVDLEVLFTTSLSEPASEILSGKVLTSIQHSPLPSFARLSLVFLAPASVQACLSSFRQEALSRGLCF